MKKYQKSVTLPTCSGCRCGIDETGHLRAHIGCKRHQNGKNSGEFGCFESFQTIFERKRTTNKRKSHTFAAEILSKLKTR